MPTGKKILIVTDTWAPEVSGVVTVLVNTILRLQQRGFQVFVVEPSAFTTVPLPFYKELRMAIFAKRGVKKMLLEEKPDAVHLMTEGALGWAARAVCQAENIPFTTSYHTHFPLYLEARMPGVLRIAYYFMRKFHNSAVRTFVSTQSLAEDLKKRGFPRVVLSPFGVDTKKFVRNLVPKIEKPQGPVFLYIGRIAVEKNIGEFLACELPGTKVVVGDGPDRKKVEAKYPSVKFAGYQRGAALVEYLSVADVLVFPSRTDTFGLVIIEALACGVPVAAHDVMGPHDIITNGRDGALGENLQEAALSCLKLSREDCRAKAETFSWEHSVDVFLENLVFIKK